MKYSPDTPLDTWDLSKIETGAICYQVHYWDFSSMIASSLIPKKDQLLVMRGPYSWTAYIGFHSGHRFWGIDYSDSIFDNVEVHGGFTFAGVGDDSYRPAGYWYLGWDYGHAEDLLDKKWTLNGVIQEVNGVYLQFQSHTQLPKASRFIKKRRILIEK